MLPIRSHYSRAMTFPKKNLNANETIALDMHPHWWYFAEAAASLLGSIILGIVVMAKTEDGSNVKKGLTLVDDHLAGRDLPCGWSLAT